MKKLAGLVGAGAMLLAMAVPTFAFWGEGWNWSDPSEATVKNYATVVNNVETEAETGDNEVGGWFAKVFNTTLRTGAAGAVSSISNLVNTNDIGCNCYDDLYIKNKGYVVNNVETEAETGDNEVGGWWTFGTNLTTGAAEAGSLISNVVNTNVVGGGN